jgi:hypothetical protein
MPAFKQVVLGLVSASAIALVPVTPAAAGVHGFRHLGPWGLGRGLVGAVFGLATLPIALASAALSANSPEAPAPYQSPVYDGPRGYAPRAYYAPPPAYYPAPQPYYAPVRSYYPRAPVYSPAPRASYAPRAYYAPRATYYGGYGGQASYRSGGYAYPRR